MSVVVTWTTRGRAFTGRTRAVGPASRAHSAAPHALRAVNRDNRNSASRLRTPPACPLPQRARPASLPAAARRIESYRTPSDDDNGTYPLLTEAYPARNPSEKLDVAQREVERAHRSGRGLGQITCRHHRTEDRDPQTPGDRAHAEGIVGDGPDRAKDLLHECATSPGESSATSRFASTASVARPRRRRRTNATPSSIVVGAEAMTRYPSSGVAVPPAEEGRVPTGPESRRIGTCSDQALEAADRASTSATARPTSLVSDQCAAGTRLRARRTAPATTAAGHTPRPDRSRASPSSGSRGGSASSAC